MLRSHIIFYLRIFSANTEDYNNQTNSIMICK